MRICVYVYMCMCIYMYIYTCIQEGTGSVRFVSVPDFSKNPRLFGSIRFGSVRFGSVRFGKLYFPIRRGSACVFWTRRGSVDPVRFGSVLLLVRFWPVPELHGSVRFGLAGSVRSLILSWSCHEASVGSSLHTPNLPTDIIPTNIA